MSADKSQSARIERLRNKTLAVFHINNPNAKEQNNACASDESIRMQRLVGTISNTTLLTIGKTTDTCCSVTNISKLVFTTISIVKVGTFTPSEYTITLQFQQSVTYIQYVDFTIPTNGVYGHIAFLANGTVDAPNSTLNGSVSPYGSLNVDNGISSTIHLLKKGTSPGQVIQNVTIVADGLSFYGTIDWTNIS